MTIFYTLKSFAVYAEQQERASRRTETERDTELPVALNLRKALQKNPRICHRLLAQVPSLVLGQHSIL
jgi:hypothetical protein